MFAENLRNLRKKRGLTQKQAAEIFGVSQSTYALYENGKREPSFDTLMHMADYFEVSCDSLLGHAEKPRVVKTYSDVIRLLIPVMETGLFKLDYVWESRESRVPAICSSDVFVDAFMERWKTMLEKKDELAFDDDLYSAWLDKQIEKNFGNIVHNQGEEFDDELPF